DQVTQQNAAMFEETTAASHALTREAEQMTEAMGRFQVPEVQSSLIPDEPIPAAPSLPSEELEEAVSLPLAVGDDSPAVFDAPLNDPSEPMADVQEGDGWEEF
ncbi:MAG: chemotaxis protein, partial [Pseudomonadota bacterium]